MARLAKTLAHQTLDAIACDRLLDVPFSDRQTETPSLRTIGLGQDRKELIAGSLGRDKNAPKLARGDQSGGARKAITAFITHVFAGF
jgi:hypothetical protein